MPFEDLVDVIETLKGRIEAHRQSLQANETRTRMALIDPLLRALGWDAEDPEQVVPEYESGSGKSGERADYALMGEGKPKAVIEAKKLGESLANHRGQMVNYANMAGIPYAGLTNGDTWEFYVCFGEPKPLEERRLLDVSISNDAAHKCALEMLLLWRRNLASGQPIEPSAPVLAGPVAPPPPRTEPSPEPIAAPPTEDWVALTELDIPPGSQGPLSIRFEDGQEASTAKSWQSLLVETGMWLDGKGLIPPDASIPSGRKRYVLHHKPIHPSEKKFWGPFRLPKSGTYLDVGIEGTIARRIRAARMLLEGCGQDPARVYVRIRT